MIMSQLIGSGSYLPERCVTNDDLSKIVDTNHEWIVQRTGIERRHTAATEECTSDLALAAALKAINNAGINKNDIDLILVSTCTPDLTFPATAILVHRKLGLTRSIPAFDLNAACSGFVYGLSVVDAFIKSGKAKTVLLIGAETLSRIIDWNDRSTCVLFGDGAGAWILQASDSKDEPLRGVLSTNLESDGSFAHLLSTTGGVSLNQKTGIVQMEGREVFRHAVEKMSRSLEKIAFETGYSLQDIDFIIPHQANQRIMDSMAKTLGVPGDRIISSIKDHANTSSASIPLAFDAHSQKKVFKKNDLIAITSLGGGFSWGSCLIRI
jgi:3-oxoacyl-[acyl-carrier-protein] synthase III